MSFVAIQILLRLFFIIHIMSDSAISRMIRWWQISLYCKYINTFIYDENVFFFMKDCIKK